MLVTGLFGASAVSDGLFRFVFLIVFPLFPLIGVVMGFLKFYRLDHLFQFLERNQ